MVQFPRFTAHGAMYSHHGTRHVDVWVTPFGDPRITGYLLLHAAFRSLSRPSSSASSKASAVDPFLLDHIIFMTLLYSCIQFECNIFLKKQKLGLKRLELLTPALSEQCSNQLSYKPPNIKKERVEV